MSPSPATVRSTTGLRLPFWIAFGDLDEISPASSFGTVMSYWLVRPLLIYSTSRLEHVIL